MGVTRTRLRIVSTGGTGPYGSATRELLDL